MQGNIVSKQFKGDQMNSLYERIGGKEAINTAVTIFYEKVLNDTRVKHFFDDVDMKHQIAKQKAFLTFAFGGPNKYDGKKMTLAHSHLVDRGLNDQHVDVIIELLGCTLKELNISDSDISEVATIAESVRGEVLGRN